MLQAGIIEESDTPWSSPVLLVTKKDGSKRFVVDFRGLNAVTSLTSWPLPTMEEVLDSIAEQRPVYWTSLDLRSGYWQAELDPLTADRTGFQVTDLGNFAFRRLPFGLCGGVQHFQMLMQKVLRGLSPAKCLIYLDDILVMGKSPTEMFNRLDEVFQRFRESRLRIHPAKCHWAVKRVKFLGHIFDERGISVDDAKFSIIRDFPVPTTPKKVRSFLGLANFYRRFIKAFSQISAPLRTLLKTDAKFVWTQQCQDAFEEIKSRLINAPILKLPDFKKPFVLTTDASTSGIAYILGQRDSEGREHAVAYGGRGLRPNETRWAITELECLALIEGVKQYHTYLAGNEFEIVTDHVSLTFLQRMKLSNNNRLTRWALFLQGYRFKITYKKGDTLTAADSISRMENLPIPEEEPERTTSPPS
ncbi:MAG TPA: reverse transcriptase family protein, partial [Methylomicrobium sp.]|nr:reverse transcriptase family protein [Methylomicrobium sp.]